MPHDPVDPALEAVIDILGDLRLDPASPVARVGIDLGRDDGTVVALVDVSVEGAPALVAALRRQRGMEQVLVVGDRHPADKTERGAWVEAALRENLRRTDPGERWLFGPSMAAACLPVRPIHPPVPDRAMQAIEADLDRRARESLLVFGVPRELLEPAPARARDPLRPLELQPKDRQP